jgi:hypothetical protein
MLVLVAAVLVVVVAAACQLFDALRSSGLDSGSPAASGKAVVQVRRVGWEPGRPFARALAAAGLPTVLQHSVITTWPAARWTPEALAAKLPCTLHGVYRNEANRFFGPYFDEARPLPAERPNPYTENASVSTADFFSASVLGADLQGRSGHMYLTQELSRLSPDGE